MCNFSIESTNIAIGSRSSIIRSERLSTSNQALLANTAKMSDRSDNLDMGSDPGYDTPVPELDDHRHRHPSASTQRAERPRRGTFDSLYGARQMETAPETPTILVRDFEEAVVDEDGAGDTRPPSRRTRRGTVETIPDGRSASPPNSVKAFAAARRREREMSFSEPKGEGEDGPARAMSISSRRSYRSKPHTLERDPSIYTNKTVEEDVCFPLQDSHRKDQLYIDFDFLENFINTERVSREQTREEAPGFQDLRPATTTDNNRTVVTSGGDFLDIPSDDSVLREKEAAEEAIHAKAPAAHQPTSADNNRFSFFSSAWESTIHAAEMADLVLPGEDIRGLFELPRDEADGVWWLNCNNVTKEEVQGICKAFGIHPLTIEDIITQEAREKIELFPSYYFACFRSFSVVEEEDGKEFEPFNTYVVVFREGTLSFSFAPNSHATQVRKRITALKDYVSLSSDWICYALM